MSAVSLLFEGVVDWDTVKAACENYSVGAAGALFGAAWWVEADAFIVQRVKGDGPAIPALYLLPGFLATIAILMINSVRRGDLEDTDSLEEGTECRIKFWLFLAYCFAFGSLFASVWFLVQSNSAGEDLWAGIAGVVQCSLILASGLIMWLLRPNPDSWSNF
mmetsp:Transcript_33379/g.85312  ORF Transcript_33379/g.85312 Transcript_33379/m.85312 type:complete len:162 (-) Transcript_33379:417-902(-)|eukprot:jgi/Tetstr1/446149/TSEL_003552.t1